MPYHPNLNEITSEQCDEEWINLPITAITLSDFVDSENMKGTISSPNFIFKFGKTESEYGAYSFEGGRIFIQEINDNDLQNLIGETPIGIINYYDLSSVGITINITQKFLNYLLFFIAKNVNGFTIRVAIPKWNNAEAKCLPIKAYQVLYKEEYIYNLQINCRI